MLVQVRSTWLLQLLLILPTLLRQCPLHSSSLLVPPAPWLREHFSSFQPSAQLWTNPSPLKSNFSISLCAASPAGILRQKHQQQQQILSWVRHRNSQLAYDRDAHSTPIYTDERVQSLGRLGILFRTTHLGRYGSRLALEPFPVGSPLVGPTLATAASSSGSPDDTSGPLPPQAIHTFANGLFRTIGLSRPNSPTHLLEEAFLTNRLTPGLPWDIWQREVNKD